MIKSFVVIVHIVTFLLMKTSGSKHSIAEKTVSSSLNSGYYPCPLMSPEERNELMYKTEVSHSKRWLSHRRLIRTVWHMM